ncbi:hypothetical protein CHS0354_024264 [Potamilus streckersoni]|uniref:Cytochrome P450 n=1 Tax=Potamilus streckersoni TaxID=2493646 RepID=A0AAE0VXK8_9BIVA|nr:hypothetical protein CHS0354_024264 [Potamilus streckersoni]
MCLQESMRLYPPVPNISRFTEKPIALPEGRLIPEGVRVGVSIFALQRHPDIWAKPDEYDPLRFSKDVTRSSIYYMPFSIGPRNCIGQQFAYTQIRIVVAMILRRFRLSLDPDREAEPEIALILRSKNGLYLKIQAISG